MKYVIDASAAIGWFLREEGSFDSAFLLDPRIVRIAPDLIFPEAANVIQRKVRSGQLNLVQAERALATLDRAFDEILLSRSLFRSAFQLARKLDHSVYDCMYLAAALSKEGGILVTSDQKFLNKAKAAGEHERIYTLELAHSQFVASQDHPNG